MIKFNQKGDFSKTDSFLNNSAKLDMDQVFNSYGRKGVAALESATPRRTGLTAASWDYRIVKKTNKTTIEWYNTNIQNGTSVAVVLQYGHGTGTGGYVQGIDYINPALKSVFDNLANDIWKEVTSK